MRTNRAVVLLCIAGCATTVHRPMQLRRVILYQNGIGYFERSGLVANHALKLQLARPELNDVLKTLTVIDRLGGSVATVDVPITKDRDRTIELGIRLGAGRAHDLLVGYAVPTPTWKAAYRVVLDDKASALLQGWAMVNNATQEDWNGISLTLATGAPMSFALDLHTPEYIKRPDATGHLIAPTVLGPIDGETVSAVDHDGDGILDTEDRCPDAGEDRDGFDDADGCPDADSDHDRIPDAVDKCPNAAETSNGIDDEDGCPDRSQLVIQRDSSLTILEPIGFARGSEALEGRGADVLDRVAQALRGNPELAQVEIGGHASSDEPEPWGLSARRAAAVRAALITRGVEANRLVLTPYGATRAADDRTTPIALAHNRRIEFLILTRGNDAPVGGNRPGLDAATLRANTRARTKPAGVAGSVRYELDEPVSIRRGASSMVSILNKAVTGEDVFLFRPDANGPGSDRHPFRAVRLVNSSGFTLEPGPVAIFARGTFVGDSLLQRLEVGETAWIPYALDGGTKVTVERATDERPTKLVSIHRGVVTIETAGIRTTRYSIAAGRDAAHTMYIHHAKAAGYAIRELPPHTLDQGDAYLIALPLAASRNAILAIEERQPRRKTITLLGSDQRELAATIENAPASVVDALRGVLALRKELGVIDEDLGALRGRVADLAQRAGEIRESIRALEKVSGAGDLRKKLVASLAQTTGDSDRIARSLGEKTEAITAARNRLADAIRDLTLDER